MGTPQDAFFIVGMAGWYGSYRCSFLVENCFPANLIVSSYSYTTLCEMNAF